MRHFFSPRVRAVLIISLVIAVLLAVASSLTGKNIPGMLVQTVMTPLRAGAKAMTDQVAQIYDYIFRYEALETENDRLKEELSQLQQDAREVDSLVRENERLRKLLELKAAHEDYELVDGYIIARSSGDWLSTLTINRGASSGIEKGMCNRGPLGSRGGSPAGSARAGRARKRAARRKCQRAGKPPRR